jgi:hypothetical protein
MAGSEVDLTLVDGLTGFYGISIVKVMAGFEYCVSDLRGAISS